MLVGEGGVVTALLYIDWKLLAANYNLEMQCPSGFRHEAYDRLVRLSSVLPYTIPRSTQSILRNDVNALATKLKFPYSITPCTTHG
jgi:hypothetical protein